MSDTRKLSGRRPLLAVLGLFLSSALVICFLNFPLDLHHDRTLLLRPAEEEPEIKVFHRHQLIREARARALVGDGDEDPTPEPTTLVVEASPADPTPTRSVLECFQVAQPIISPVSLPADGANVEDGERGDGKEDFPCTVTLMEHKFANSYGEPFVG